jgi:hypothetical protein
MVVTFVSFCRYVEAHRLVSDASSSSGLAESSFALAASALRLSGRPVLLVPRAGSVSAKRGVDSDLRRAPQSPLLLAVTLEEISRERALAEARCVLPRLTASASAQECFSLLVSERQLSKALDLGRLFKLDLSPCFEQLARNVLARLPLMSGDLFGEPGEAGLATLVRSYDSRTTCHRYGLSVAAVWLESSQSARLPAWLFLHLEQRHPEALLQLLVSHGRQSEALRVALSLLRDVRVSIPLGLLDKLRSTLKNDQQSQSILEAAFARAVQERSVVK